MLFNILGDKKLGQLSRKGRRIVKVEIFGKLLGDGTAALEHFVSKSIVQQGANGRNNVKPTVVVETMVLSGDDGIFVNDGDIIYRGIVGLRLYLTNGFGNGAVGGGVFLTYITNHAANGGDSNQHK